MTAVRLIGIAPAARHGADILAMGPLAAVLAGPETTETREAVRRHHRAVVAECRLGPFLPAPFGLVFDDPDALRRRVEQATIALLATLDRCAGKAEWSVRLTPLPQATPDGLTPGRRFLAERRAAAGTASAGQALADRLRAIRPPPPVAGLLAEPDRHGLLRASLLVPTGTAKATLTACWDHVAEAMMLRDEPVAIDGPAGPWPPYRFAALRRHLVPDAPTVGGEVDDAA